MIVTDRQLTVETYVHICYKVLLGFKAFNCSQGIMEPRALGFSKHEVIPLYWPLLVLELTPTLSLHPLIMFYSLKLSLSKFSYLNIFNQFYFMKILLFI